MAENKIKMADLLRFFAYHVNNLTLCARYIWKVFLCILFKFVMHVTNEQFSDEFDDGWKKIKMADLVWFFAFYVNNLTLW